MSHAAKAALLALSLTAATPALAQPSACPPAGYDIAALRQSEWRIESDRARNAFARALIPCLANPDPALRDGVAFEALSHLLRARQLNTNTMRAMQAELQPWLTAPEGDGFARPFAALALSELARADRIAPYLTPAERTRLLSAAIAYYTGVTDYRGFNEHEGWRHGVAHGSDLLLQLALNPALAAPDLTRIRDALATQIAPPNHFYIYGEPERIARATLYLAQRNSFTEAEWTAWFARIAAPPSDNVYASNAALAWRHNTMAFLTQLRLNAELSESGADNVLLPGLTAALNAMP